MTPMDTLRTAYRQRNLSLYLGAGVSVGNGLPSWEALVLAMYFKVIDEQRLGRWRPFPNYLLAIAEWQLKHLQEPLEISARKIRHHFGDDQQGFLASLWDTLYEGFQPEQGQDFQPPNAWALRDGNRTLGAVVELCAPRPTGGVRSVVSYNYDSLLETGLDEVPCQPIWNAQHPPGENVLPIYHVHGYVPLDRSEGSGGHDIVFTEDQYNRVANDPYSWTNLVQIRNMSSHVGLMVGLSLADRNMRRLLDAVRGAPIVTRQFALLKRASWDAPRECDLDTIDDKAMSYFDRFARSGAKRNPGEKGRNWRAEIAGILQAVREKGSQQEEKILHELGVMPIWIDDFEEIPERLKEIMA